MADYTKAREGYHFEPSDLGNMIPKVYGKYLVSDQQTKTYRKMVPSAWIRDGWIKEVENGEE